MPVPHLAQGAQDDQNFVFQRSNPMQIDNLAMHGQRVIKFRSDID